MSSVPPGDRGSADFTAYARLADDLIEGATKEQIADAARF